MDVTLKRSALAMSEGNSRDDSDNEPKRQRIGEELIGKLSWANLPAHILADIGAKSGVSERSSMFQVNRWWSHLFEAEIIRDTLTITIGHSPEPNYSDQAETQYVVRYGDFLKRVDMHFKKDVTQLTLLEVRQIRRILQNLSRHAQLNSVGFHDSGSCSVHDDDNPDFFTQRLKHVGFYQATRAFLLTQNKLTSVEFRNCYFSKVEAETLLQAIYRNNRRTIVKLELRGFFIEPCLEDSSLGYLLEFNLKTLAIDYCKAFESIVISYAKHLISNIYNNTPVRNVYLQRICLNCSETFESGLIGFPQEMWLLLKTTCPNLRVDISFSPGINNGYSGLSTYLKKHMPLRVLEINSQNIGVTHRLHCEVFFRCLGYCRFHDTLEQLSVVWTQQAMNFVDWFAAFTKYCSRLKRVRMSFQNPVPNLGTLFDSWVNNKPPVLEFAHFTVTSVLTREELKYFTDLGDNYVSLLQKLGIRLVLIVNRLP